MKESISNMAIVSDHQVRMRQQQFQLIYNRSHVKIGRYVKIPFEDMDGEETLIEHMWVEITQNANGEFIGRLDNDPFIVRNVKFNDIVTVDFNQIEQII